MSETKRIQELDALRGLAALSVLLFHLTCTFRELYPLSGWNPFFTLREGHLGVELFFMISGFVIFMSLCHASSLLSFWITRISRLYPAYWVSVLVGYVALRYLPGWQPPISSKDFLWNLSMFQDLPHRGIPHVQAVYWTLSCEMNFYLLVSLLFFSGLYKRFNVFLLFSVAGSMCYHLLAARTDVSSLHHFYFYFLIDNNLLLFLLGMSFYLSYREPENKWVYFRIPLLLAAYCYAHDAVRCVAVCCFSLLFFLVIRGQVQWLRLKVLGWLGGISYSLYLLHQNLLYAIVFVCMQRGYFNGSTPILLLLFLLAAAALSRYLLEGYASGYMKQAMQQVFKNVTRVQDRSSQTADR